jgi:Amt family ammonium transporter
MAGVMSLLWVAYGYSLAFGQGSEQWQWAIGNLDKVMLRGVTLESVTETIPESLFVAFQMTFAIITPALIVGAFAERMRFSAMVLFTVLWFTFSYLPICHMAWAGDGALFDDWGVIDFAGGTVVHVNAGIAGLVTCLMIGRRSGFPKEVMRPHNLPFAVMGAGMLWVGWFGFNAGSALGANQEAAMALLVTHIAAAAAAVVWSVIEVFVLGKASALGIATGAVAGLVAITPASGSVGPIGGLVIGAASSLVCYYFATKVKHAFGYDDSLDVFGVHGIGGIVGALLAGVFVASEFGGAGLESEMTIASQVWAQAKSILVTAVWSAVVSALAFVIVDKLVGMRVPVEIERGGLDIAEHHEQAYDLV